MQIQLTSAHLILYLSGVERLWSVHIGEQITIPRDRILQASHVRPKTTAREIRAPGAYFPGLIKAGTYYTERGREFWYCQGKDKSVLCLDIDPSEYYKRIVVNLPEGSEIRAEQLI